MPWKTRAEAREHKKGMSDAECDIWLAAANRSLSKDGDDGKAIRIANAAVNNYRAGKKG